MKTFILILFLPLAMSAQYVNKSILNLNEFPDSVKSLERVTVSYEFGELDTTRIDSNTERFEFDSTGECIRYESKSESGDPYVHEKTFRDKGRTVISHFIGAQNDSTVEKRDDKGNVVLRTQYADDGTILVDKWTYDSKGHITQHSSESGNSRTTQKVTFNKKGQKKTFAEFRKNSKGGKEVKISSIDYVYNEKNQEIMTISKQYTEGIQSSVDTTRNTYNSQGKLAQTISTYSNGTKSSTWTYSYDAAGNLVKEEYSANEADYVEFETEKWTFDANGYWSSYRRTSYQEVSQTFTTVYNEQGLPVSCVVIGMGQKSVTTWKYEMR